MLTLSHISLSVPLSLMHIYIYNIQTHAIQMYVYPETSSTSIHQGHKYFIRQMSDSSSLYDEATTVWPLNPLASGPCFQF